MGSYLVYGPKIYPKVHENPRTFSFIFDPVFLESPSHGFGDGSLPWEDCITFYHCYHHYHHHHVADVIALNLSPPSSLSLFHPTATIPLLLPSPSPFHHYCHPCRYHYSTPPPSFHCYYRHHHLVTTSLVVVAIPPYHYHFTTTIVIITIIVPPSSLSLFHRHRRCRHSHLVTYDTVVIERKLTYPIYIQFVTSLKKN